MKKKFNVLLISLLLVCFAVPATTFAGDEDNPHPTDYPVEK